MCDIVLVTLVTWIFNSFILTTLVTGNHVKDEILIPKNYLKTNSKT